MPVIIITSNYSQKSNANEAVKLAMSNTYFKDKFDAGAQNPSFVAS